MAQISTTWRRDERTLLPAPDSPSNRASISQVSFGIRSEINVHLGHSASQVTTLPMQAGIVPLLHMVE